MKRLKTKEGMTLVETVVSILLVMIMLTMVVAVVSPAFKVFIRMQRLQFAQMILDNVEEDMKAELRDATTYVKIYETDGENGTGIIDKDGVNKGEVLEYVNTEGYIVLVSANGCAAFFEYSDEVLISVSGILVFAFLAVLMAVALIDWDTQIIYDRFHIIILILGIIAIWVFPVTDIKSRIIGLFIISVPMYILTWIIPGAFGGGDVKLVAACGWFLGVKAVVTGTFVGFLAGGTYAVVLLALKKIGRKDHFAFGPFLAAGYAVAVFLGNFLADWYISLL